LNPIERVWPHIKQELSWEVYENLDEIKEKVRAFIEDFSRETIASITGWDYILSAINSVAVFWRNGIKTFAEILRSVTQLSVRGCVCTLYPFLYQENSSRSYFIFKFR